MSDNYTDKERSEELEVYALFIHGVSSTIHGMGTIYHLRRKNIRHALFHLTATIYSGASTYYHKQYHDKLKDND